LPVVHGDRVHLQQVLLNLILNGMDAMAGCAAAERLLTVRAKPAKDGSVEVTVSDCGTGIPPDKMKLLFEPFFTTKPDGMGMGLAISRTIIEAHNGKIQAENNAPRGATFKFTLPAKSQ
jgi:two-component system sensor kinase FixL